MASSTREQDKMSARAYELYVSRGATDGRGMDDWLKAEEEILARPAKQSKRVRARKTASKSPPDSFAGLISAFTWTSRTTLMPD